ncbi:MAG: DUF6407 family protein [Bacillus sp. (in: Bacteria)]|nr:DUF6407 family protein [Bacillus sp. (in: firmicutes)]
MKSKLSIPELAQQLIEDKKNKGFSLKDNRNVQELVSGAIDYYDLNSKEVIEHTGEKQIKTLYVASIAEENMLTRFVQALSGNDDTIEAIYNGQIVRKH